MKTEVVTITPEMAKEMLDGNTSNRPISRTHMLHLSRQMKHDAWKLNGEAIKMNGSRLLDGQHRLHACIHANKPFRTLVLSGVEETVFDTLDTGKNRSGSDVLAISGIHDAKLMQAAVYAIRFVRSGADPKAGRRNQTNAEVLQFVTQNSGLSDAGRFVRTLPVCSRILGVGLAAALRFEFNMRNKAISDSFFRSLETGVDLEQNNPVRLLREKLLANGGNTMKLARREKVALAIKAWNLLRAGVGIKRLVFFPNKEEFPTID